MLKIFRSITLLAVMFVVTACGGELPTTASSDANSVTQQVPIGLAKVKSKVNDLWPVEWPDFCSGKTFVGWMPVKVWQSNDSNGTTTYFIERMQGIVKLSANDGSGATATLMQTSGSESESYANGDFLVVGDAKWRVITQGSAPNSTITTEFKFELVGGVFTAQSTGTYKCQGQ